MKPFRLTPKVWEAITLSLKCGASITAAAAAAGVPGDTVREWIARGEGRDKRAATPQLREFAAAVRDAQGVAEDHAVKVVRKAMEKSWQAAAWFLERVHKDRYGQSIKQDVTLAQVDMSKLTDEELEKIESGDFSPLAGQSGT